MKTRLFIYIALAVDILIAVAKFSVAAFTRSSAMISEGIHSSIDAVSQLLLIWGVNTSKKQANEKRPFGYGRDLYFWSFIVSLIIFFLGGCISFYEGWLRFKRPGFQGNPKWEYFILLFAFIFNFVSMMPALQAFNKLRGKTSFWQAVVRTKDPSTLIVLLGDFGDLLGLVVAFLGIYLGRLYHNPYYDGIASMIIGAILIVISAVLIRESKSLLLGETTSRKNQQKVLQIAEADKSVIKIKKQFSTVLAPDQIVFMLKAVFQPGLTTQQITDSIERIIKAIQAEFPHIKQIFIEPVSK